MSTSTSTPAQRMPPIELTDYPSLAMGHDFSKTDISIVGLDLQIFGLEEIKDSQKPIVALVRPQSLSLVSQLDSTVVG